MSRTPESDADCKDSPCGKCVFLRVLSWSFHDHVSIHYDGASCI